MIYEKEARGPPFSFSPSTADWNTFEAMRTLIALLLASPLFCCAQPPAGYYDPAAGLSGEGLRNALQLIIDGHNELSYTTLWSAFGLTDRKPNMKVWDMYSDVPSGTPAYEYAFVTDQCGAANSEGDCFNREHTFPQSWFNSTTPMNSDLFHLYPTDGFVNQERDNWAYGEVGNASWTGSNGSKLGTCNFPGCSGTVFEPIDAYKGDLARSYFYLLTRYHGQENSWLSPMLLNGELRPWAEALLISWHQQDPVSQKEIDRNNRVYSLQFNRNPFIDNPNWVPAIWGPTASVNELGAAPTQIWLDAGALHIVRHGSSGTAALTVVDVQGSLVAQRQFAGDRTLVPLEIAAGVYVVTIQGPEGRFVKRVVR